MLCVAVSTRVFPLWYCVSSFFLCIFHLFWAITLNFRYNLWSAWLDLFLFMISDCQASAPCKSRKCKGVTMTQQPGMWIFRDFTEFRKFNSLHMSLLNLMFSRNCRNSGVAKLEDFPAESYKNTQAGCESRLPAYCRA